MRQTCRILGDNVKALRLAHGLSQEELAFEAELDRTYISMLERALRQPTLETVLSLSRALGVTASEIVAMVEARFHH